MMNRETTVYLFCIIVLNNFSRFFSTSCLIINEENDNTKASYIVILYLSAYIKKITQAFFKMKRKD